MNLLKTIKDQVGSRLSNLESEIKALTEKSKEGTLENADSSLQKGVVSAFGVLKNVLSKGVDTCKETVNRIDLSGSVTDTVKNALEKGTNVIKGVATNLNDSDSITGVEKYILNKRIDTAEQIKEGVNSTGSIADTVKSTLNKEKVDNLHASAIKDVAANLNDSGSVTGVAKYILNKGIDTAEQIKEGVNSTGSIVDTAKSTLNSEKVDNLHASAIKDVAANLNDSGSVTGVAKYILNKGIDTTEEMKVADEVRPDTTTLSDVMANAAFGEDSDEAVNAAKNIADADNLNPVYEREDKSQNDLLDEVIEIPPAEKFVAGTKSSSDQSTRTLGSALAMGATTRTSQVGAKDSSATISLDGTSWEADNKSRVDSSSFELDEFDDIVISASDSSLDGPVSAPIAKAEKSKLNWILLPMMLLLGLSVAWWLNIDQNGQFTEEADFAVLEPADTELPEMSSAEVGMDGDSSTSNSVPVENSVAMTEVTGLVGRSDPAKGEGGDDVLLAESKDSQVVASISTNPDAKTTSPSPIEEDRRNSSSDSDILAEQVAVTQKARVVSRMSGGTTTRISRGSSPVEAITTFLESDADSLPPPFTLHGLTFRIASSTITRDSRKIVSDLAATLKAHPTTMIRLEGHTDNSGRPDSNRALSASRASAVRTALVNLNLDPARITAQGLGANHPVADNDTKVGRLKNRRVDVIITKR